MKVLIGIDGSENAYDAIRQVSALLSPEQDQIALFYAAPEVQISQIPPPSEEMRLRAKKALADAVMEEAIRHLPEEFHARVETIVGHQQPAHGLTTAADSWRADLIVVGARGAGGMQRLLLGSVSRSAVHNATIPVLVVRTHDGRPADAPPRVLLACDGSPSSLAAGEFIKQFTWPAATLGQVITVVESLLVGQVPRWLEERAREADVEAMAQAWAREHEQGKEQKRREMIDYAATLPEPFQHQEPLIREGGPAEQILECAERQSADIIVLGARGLGVWARWLIGSTSEKVLNHAPCSVLIVPLHEEP